MRAWSVQESEKMLYKLAYYIAEQIYAERSRHSVNKAVYPDGECIVISTASIMNYAERCAQYVSSGADLIKRIRNGKTTLHQLACAVLGYLVLWGYTRVYIRKTKHRLYVVCREDVDCAELENRKPPSPRDIALKYVGLMRKLRPLIEQVRRTGKMFLSRTRVRELCTEAGFRELYYCQKRMLLFLHGLDIDLVPIAAIGLLMLHVRQKLSS